MTRTEVIEALSQRMNCDKREAKQFLEVLTELIESTIRSGRSSPERSRQVQGPEPQGARRPQSADGS